MADDYTSPLSDRDVVREEVWYDRRPLWSRILEGLPLRRLVLAVLVVTLLVLLGLFTYSVLYPTYWTPIITVSSVPYQWPFPPQAWVAEDLARLFALQQQRKNP